MLYFVSTPIGNLKDITLRAIEVLNSVDLIACEDTSHSLPLLNHYQISKPLISYQKFNEMALSEKIVDSLKEGKNVAVISDAGTPVLSDPGGVLVKKLVENNLPFTVVPGANALLPALILSGLDTSNFVFIGFLPEKNSERDKLIDKYMFVPASLVFYCAPHDLNKILDYLYSRFGARQAVLVKEITKLYENRYPITLGEKLDIDQRGEFVIVVEGAKAEENFSDISLADHVALYQKEGLSKMDAIKRVSKERGIAKSVLYKMLLDE